MPALFDDEDLRPLKYSCIANQLFAGVVFAYSNCRWARLRRSAKPSTGEQLLARRLLRMKGGIFAADSIAQVLVRCFLAGCSATQSPLGFSDSARLSGSGARNSGLHVQVSDGL